MVRLTFLTHAPTEATRGARFPADEPLREGETERIRALGWVAPRAQRVLVAPELRTRQTAEASGLDAAENEPPLREFGYGLWSGKGLEEVQADQPEGLMEWLTDAAAAPHGGESLAALIGRVAGWMDGLKDEGDAGHVLAVTHPAVVRAAVVHGMGAPAEAFWRVEAGPLTLTDIRLGGRGWVLRAAGVSLRAEKPS